MLRNFIFKVLIVVFVLACHSQARVEAEEMAPAGREYRIFVDKAHPAHSRLNAADFKQLADAGFTHVVSRWAVDAQGKAIDMGEYARLAAASGIDVYKWDYGLVNATENSTHHLNRLGKETRYTSPLDPWAWQELTRKLTDYARLSRETPNFKGVLLDFEIYGGNKTDGFSESFDDRSLRLFMDDLGYDSTIELPAADKRKSWLENRQWYQLYIGWHLEKVARNVRALRQAVDAINPRFQFGVYGWGVLTSPYIQELATPQAPVLVLNAMTYGRSAYSNAFEGGYDGDRPDREGLQWSLETVQKGIKSAHQRYDNVIYLAGHYPQSPGPPDGTQFKFTARQAYQSALFGEGYWIWTDWNTPKPWTDRREWYDAMIAYFGKANAAVKAKDRTWLERELSEAK